MVLARGGVPFGAAVTATIFERVLAAGLLFGFSIVGLVYLLQEIGFDVQKGGAYLIWMIGSMLAVGIVVIFSVLRDEVRQIRTDWVGRSLCPIGLTILSHAAMLAAYTVILVELHPERMSLAIVAALTIVMFTSSLPISFSGWGVRELSAATALSLVGVPSSLAVAAAFSVGLLTIVIMALFAIVSFVVIRKAPAVKVQTKQSAPMPASAWDFALIKICALFCAVFVFFQIRVPLPTHNLSVNVADVAAITGGALIALLLITKRLPFPLPRYAAACLLGISLLVVGGLVVAYFNNILGSWALINRGVGWLILLSYVAVAAGLVATSGEHGRAMMMRAAAVAAVAVCLLQLGRLMIGVAFAIPTDVFMIPLQGYVDNQNAFSLQLAMVAILLVVGVQNGTFHNRAMFVFAFIVIGLTIYYTRSRTGLILFAGIAVWMYSLTFIRTVKGRSARRSLRLGAMAVSAAMVAAFSLPYLIAYGWASLTNASPDALLSSLTRTDALGLRIMHAESEAERWRTIADGWHIFLDHPVFGSGLGGYMEQRLSLGREGDVIHSVPVWLLAETGVVGTALIIFLAWTIMREGWRLRSFSTTSPYGWGLLAAMAVMTAGGLVHDFFYQRIFWFLFGIMAVPLVDNADGQPTGKSYRAEPPALPCAIAQPGDHEPSNALSRKEGAVPS